MKKERNKKKKENINIFKVKIKRNDLSQLNYFIG